MNTGRERGSGTVLGAGLALVLVALIAAVLVLVQTMSAASRAATAADLAALAAADAARGLAEGRPCEVAASVARQNDVQLVGCRITDGSIADIFTAVEVPAWGTATGRSRAGPPPG